jgi:hypothetical protein
MAPLFAVEHAQLRHKQLLTLGKRQSARNGQSLVSLSATGAVRILKMQSLNCAKSVANISGIMPIELEIHAWRKKRRLEHAQRALLRHWIHQGIVKNIYSKILCANMVSVLVNTHCTGKSWSAKISFVITLVSKSFRELMQASTTKYHAVAEVGRTILTTASGAIEISTLSKTMQQMKNLLISANALQENFHDPPCERVKQLRRTQQPSAALLSLPGLKAEVSRSKTG